MNGGLPKSIEGYLRSVIARRNRIALVRAGGRALLFALAGLLLACLLDRVLRLAGPVRAAMLAVIAAGAVLAVARPLLRFLRGARSLAEAAALVESRNPAFRQRLCTVVSQWAAPPAYRGSQAMLDRLTAKVARLIEVDRPARWLPSRGAIPPWIAAAVVAAMGAGLWFIPSLDMRTLLARMVRPMAPIPPASSVRITLDPVNPRQRVGQTFSVVATVERLREGDPVDIFTSRNGVSWSRIPMLAISDNEYLFSLAELDRDLFYYVRAGDGQTPVYRATVQRAAAVAEYRMRLQYPPYTMRPEANLSNTDGMVEALTGTRLRLQLVCTEPLASAALVAGSTRIPLAIGADPLIAQGEMVIQKSFKADLELVSREQMPSRIPDALTVRAQQDREPTVLLMEPALDLRADPWEILPIRYQAADDLGLVQLWASVAVNGRTPLRIALPVPADSRRAEDQMLIDLARLGLSAGDVAAIELHAVDGAGGKVSSPVRRFAIVFQSAGLRTQRRVFHLRQATAYAASALDELDRAVAALRPDSQNDDAAARLRISSALGAAIEATDQVPPALLRAGLVSSSPETGPALLDSLDRARVQSAVCQRLLSSQAPVVRDAALADQLRLAQDSARRLSEQVRLLADGEQAAALLLERSLRAAFRQAGSGEATAVHREALDAWRQQLVESARAMGLNYDGADLDAALRRHVATASAWVRSCRPVDWTSVAEIWATARLADDHPLPPLPQRLATAAMAEALWPWGDATAARDLQLASRVASRLVSATLTQDRLGRDLAGDVLVELPRILGALQGEHALLHQGDHRLDAEEIDQVRRAGAAARLRLLAWAGQTEDLLLAESSQGIELEDLALAANLEMRRKRFTIAGALDQKLSSQSLPSGTPQAAPLAAWMAAIQSLDRLVNEQQRLAQQARQAVGEPDLQRLLRQQRQIAIRIDQVDVPQARLPAGQASVPDPRRRALVDLGQSGEEVAALPARFATALEARQAVEQARLRAEQAIRDAEGNRVPVAQRVADQAVAALDEKRRAFATHGAYLVPGLADRLAAQVKSAGPRGADAAAGITRELRPAMSRIQQALRSSEDSDVRLARQAIEQSTGVVLAAIELAQSRIIESEPLAAARVLAELAGDALADRPVDVRRLQARHQALVLALTQAMNNAMDAAARERLMRVPVYRAVLMSKALPTAANPAGRQALADPTGVRQWASPAIATYLAPPETAPTAMQESLRLYFEAIAAAREKAGTK